MGSHYEYKLCVLILSKPREPEMENHICMSLRRTKCIFLLCCIKQVKKMYSLFSNTLKEWNLVLTQQKKSFFVYMMEVKNISCYCPF
jgi:hypothetical protein